ncbi:hypothetical protein D9M70_550160 [compost metagenome]
MQKEGDARRAAGEQAGACEKIEAECGDQAAGEDALQVLDRCMPGRAGVPDTENAADLSHGKTSIAMAAAMLQRTTIFKKNMSVMLTYFCDSALRFMQACAPGTGCRKPVRPHPCG